MFADSMEYCSCVRLKKKSTTTHLICISLLISLPFITCPFLPKKWGLRGKIELIQNFICMYNSDALFQCYVPASNLLYNICYRIYSYENFSLRSLPSMQNNTIQSSLKELVILFLELLITGDGCDEIIFVWKGWYCIVIENYEHCYGYLMCSCLRVTHQELNQSSLKHILWNIKFRLEINEFQKWKEI